MGLAVLFLERCTVEILECYMDCPVNPPVKPEEDNGAYLVRMPRNKPATLRLDRGVHAAMLLVQPDRHRASMGLQTFRVRQGHGCRADAAKAVRVTFHK